MPHIASSLTLVNSKRLSNGLYLEEYEGLSSDMPDKLPHHGTLATGSSAMAVDDSDVYYKYEKTTDKWYLQE